MTPQKTSYSGYSGGGNIQAKLRKQHKRFWCRSCYFCTVFCRFCVILASCVPSRPCCIVFLHIYMVSDPYILRCLAYSRTNSPHHTNSPRSRWTTRLGGPSSTWSAIGTDGSDGSYHDPPGCTGPVGRSLPNEEPTQWLWGFHVVLCRARRNQWVCG